MSPRDAAQELVWREVQAILVEEVAALPERYRTPFVLCRLEGLSREEAARELGIKEGTVSSRLDRARKHLSERLLRRGIALSVVLAALDVVRSNAAIPGRLVDATVRAGLAHLAGDLSGGALSSSAEALLRAVTRSLGATPGRIATALLAAVLLVGGLALLPDPLLGQPKGKSPPRAEQRSDASNKSPAVKERRPASTEAADTDTVSGKVLDPTGKPFAGAEVTVRWGQIHIEAADPPIKATSGRDGGFRLRFRRSALGKPLLPPNVDPYHFSPLQVVASAKGYGAGWTYVHVLRGATGEGLTLRLVRDEVPIKGRILDVQLRPVTDATIRVLRVDDAPFTPWPRLPHGAKTDKEGRFVLTGIGRDRKVRLAIEGSTIERKKIEVSTANAATATVEVIARPTRVIEGTVTAADTGKPLAGVVIRGGQQHGRYTGFHTLTDAKGRYRLVGFAKGGGYEVTAWPNRGQPYLPRTATPSDSPGLKPITVDFRLTRGAALRIRLVDKSTGKPVRGWVHYEPLGNNPCWAELVKNGGGLFPMWQFTVAYPDCHGICHLVAAAGPGVVVGQGHDLPYLTRPIDPADKKVYPFIEKTPYTIGGLAYYWDLFQSYRSFDAKVGDKPLDLDIELDPGCKVEGKLVGPDGKPLNGVLGVGLAHATQKVNNYSYRNDPVYRATVESRTLETDRFVAVGLTADGARTVTFLHPGRKLIANVVVRANQKGPLTVKLAPWGAVTGRLIDEHGKPVSGLTVELLYPDQESIGLLKPGTGGSAPGVLAPGRPFRTDANGRFCIEGLIPGRTHRLTFSGGEVKDVSAKAGAVHELGDITLSKPAGKSEKGASR